MCFPSFPFVTHVLPSPWLTFHLLQVPLSWQCAGPLCRSACQNAPWPPGITVLSKPMFCVHLKSIEHIRSHPPQWGMTRSRQICLYWTTFWSTVYWCSLDSGNYLNNEQTKMNLPWISSSSCEWFQGQHLESIMRQEIKSEMNKIVEISQVWSHTSEVYLAVGEYKPDMSLVTILRFYLP